MVPPSAAIVKFPLIVCIVLSKLLIFPTVDAPDTFKSVVVTTPITFNPVPLNFKLGLSCKVLPIPTHTTRS